MTTKLDFALFKTAVEEQWAFMTPYTLYRTAIPKDALWDTYLKSFPPGTNPKFRERTEHDCSCCRQFIRTIGNVVRLRDGEVMSLWDFRISDPAYQAVAEAMAAAVKAHPVEDVFLHSEKSVGTDKNFEQGEEGVITWTHFHLNIPYGRNSGHSHYCPGIEIGTRLSEFRATYDVFLRGLSELTQDAFDTVLELIGQNSLYRGKEFESNLRLFSAVKQRCEKLEPGMRRQRELFAWEEFPRLPVAVARIRNTAIGTLLVDLSNGVELEKAVRTFETTIMAPANYKRPTALVTEKQRADAKKTVEDLGLMEALERRYAHLRDITANNIIFADRTIRKVLERGAFDDLPTKTESPKNLDKVATVPLAQFITDIVPKATSIEVFLENKHASNLVSLVAPVHKDAARLFKWENGFSWAYNGDVADSLKEKVKRAGGNVTGDLCCRLAWFNHDDLDLHMLEPNGTHIFFGNKRPYGGTTGQLDVDMNAGTGTTREPVENIFYPLAKDLKEGVYTLYVHQFAKRESDNVGFEVEVDFRGEVQRFAYGKQVRQGERIDVIKFKYSHQDGLTTLEALPGTVASRTVWGLKTNDFHRVNVLMLSPNHWDGEGVGNKHYFFMLDGCTNEGTARGFFNEFLRGDLDKHRKVLELVGSKMKTGESADQLSGLGFSETRPAELLVRVKGSFTRVLKVVI